LNNYSQYVGIVAGILTGVSLLPQLIKIIKEKKANSISFGMLAVLLAGLCVMDCIWHIEKRLPDHCHE
jgi:MtN3 and saliva related transmembrane protein